MTIQKSFIFLSTKIISIFFWLARGLPEGTLVGTLFYRRVPTNIYLYIKFHKKKAMVHPNVDTPINVLTHLKDVDISLYNELNNNELLCKLFYYLLFLHDPELSSIPNISIVANYTVNTYNKRAAITTSEESPCPYCLSPLCNEQCIVTKCDHLLHQNCWYTSLIKYYNISCPICRQLCI